MNEDLPSGDGSAAAGAETALRQLRGRYDELRADYEALLRRLSDLEAQAGTEDDEGPPEPPRATVFESMLAPLAGLRDEYIAALDSLRGLVGGIDDLLPRGMKAQRSFAPQPGGMAGRRLQVDVRGRSPGELLDFRERLAALAGVETVSIHAIDAERVVLVVQLA